MNTENHTDRLISLRAVAQHLGISLRGVYRLVSSGQLPPPVKVGGASRIFLSDVDAYMESLRTARPNP